MAIRTLMNWAVRKKYLSAHDLDGIDPALRRRGRRRYIPEDADVVRAYAAARGEFRGVLLALMVTGVRTKELRTVTVDEFDRANRQWVLWRHKVVEKTGQPKVVALGSDELLDLCVASAGDRPRDEPLFLTERGKPWTYQAMRLRWRTLRSASGSTSGSRSTPSAIGTSPWPWSRGRTARSSPSWPASPTGPAWTSTRRSGTVGSIRRPVG